MATTGITSIINELSATYPKYKFSRVNKTYEAKAIINVKCKPGEEDLAYYGGDDYGYCAYSESASDFVDIRQIIKDHWPNCRVSTFIDGKRSGSFAIY